MFFHENLMTHMKKLGTDSAYMYSADASYYFLISIFPVPSFPPLESFFFLMCPFDPSLQMITSSCSSHLSNSIPTIAQVKNSVSRLSFSHFIANTTAKILALPLKSSPNPSVPCRSLDHIPVQDTLSWPLGN